MTAQRPDFPVDEEAGLVKFSQVSEDQTSRSMSCWDLYKFNSSHGTRLPGR